MKTRDMALIALFAALIAICAWISIPAPVPFTLQTMAVFLAVGLLGGKRGTIAVAVYIMLGAVGLPVFSGFNGGIGALLGPTGGYLIAYPLMALLIALILNKTGRRSIPLTTAAMWTATPTTGTTKRCWKRAST